MPLGTVEYNAFNQFAYVGESKMGVRMPYRLEASWVWDCVSL